MTARGLYTLLFAALMLVTALSVGSAGAFLLGVAALCVYGFGMGLTGAWVGMATDLTVRGVLTYARFRSSRWERIASARAV